MVPSRKECFFGLHFDFHAMPGDEVGSVIDIASIEEMLDATKPDMIQVDTKGHAGISSYMTEVGVHAEVMHMDVLRVWRELTAKRGIRLYVHHSGLYDEMQAKLHPDWESLNAEGVPYGGRISAFSPYVREVLIPQILEMAAYGAEGAWIDGDEWAAFVDYSEYAKRAWQAAGNVGEPPKPDEEGYLAYAEFCREGFRRYVATYVAAVKEKYPDFEITSNWMYTHTMPEKRTVPIDFISGDYNCSDAVNSGRLAARCILPQGLTWDLMAWGQNARPCSWQTRNRSTKEAPQLCQEAAVVLALGGGFQFFNILYGTGGLVQRWAIPSWREVAEFCRARQPFCFGGVSAADIGVIYPAYYNDRPLFTGGAYRALCGFLAMLSDAGYSADVVNEADLAPLSRYRVILLPAAREYRPETLEALRRFAEAGGTVIADGGVALGEELAGATFDAGTQRLIFPDCGERLSCLDTTCYTPTLRGAVPLLSAYRGNYYLEAERESAALVHTVGAGKVATLTFTLSTVYADNVTYALKQFTKRLLSSLGYLAPVSVSGSDYADLTLMKKDGHLVVHLINLAGEHNAVGVRTFREIPAIGPLTVTLRTGSAPKKVTLRPEGEVLTVTAGEDGYLCHLPKLSIHSILEVEI